MRSGIEIVCAIFPTDKKEGTVHCSTMDSIIANKMLWWIIFTVKLKIHCS